MTDSGAVLEFRLPDLGEGLPEAEIVQWLVAEGAAVSVDGGQSFGALAQAVIRSADGASRPAAPAGDGIPVPDAGTRAAAAAAPAAATPAVAEPEGPRAPLPFTRSVWPGRAATHRPAPRPEPARIGPFTKTQWAGAVVVGWFL